MTRPIPRRPRVARIKCGSSFQARWTERNLPSRVLARAAYARLRNPGGRCGSTYLTPLNCGGATRSRLLAALRSRSRRQGSGSARSGGGPPPSRLPDSSEPPAAAAWRGGPRGGGPPAHLRREDRGQARSRPATTERWSPSSPDRGVAPTPGWPRRRCRPSPIPRGPPQLRYRRPSRRPSRRRPAVPPGEARASPEGRSWPLRSSAASRSPVPVRRHRTSWGQRRAHRRSRWRVQSRRRFRASFHAGSSCPRRRNCPSRCRPATSPSTPGRGPVPPSRSGVRWRFRPASRGYRFLLRPPTLLP